MPKLLERSRELATQMEFGICVSTEDNVTTSLHTWEDGQVGQMTCGEIKKCPMELIEMHADRKKVQTHLSQETANERAQ